MHPWEFYQYSLQEYIAKRKGYDVARRKQLRQAFQRTQMSAYYSILPYLSKSDRKKSIDQLVPNPYDETPTKVVSLKEQYEALKEKYRKAGVKL